MLELRRVLSAALVSAVVLASTSCMSEPENPSTSWGAKPVRIGGLSVLAESDRDGFRLHTSSGDKGFLPGVNLGSTLPTLQPGEVGQIPAEHYRRWISQMGDLGIRVVRVYTLLPPGFYAELAAYNEEHPVSPIYLVQGAYLPNEGYVDPGRSLYDAEIDDSFSAEIRDLSAAVHGDLVREEAPGRAWGTYDVDVSAWVASWIIGVEWDGAAVQRTNRRSADAPYSPGKFFAATDAATPTERWIAKHMDEIATLEAERGVSVPVAMANWPTADPLEHPSEPLHREDLPGVDANHVLPTAAWPGGTFASFHAYPYYPDFQRYQDGLDETLWAGEPDRYAGYLKSLKEHFADTMPLLVTEYGVPASLGSAHIGTNGRDQGGHSEPEAMEMNAEMMRMMEDLGLGGAFVFVWADEWFKRTWNTMEHQVGERRQLWHDPLTNEQWFGLVATDPAPLVDAAVEELPEDLPADGAYEYLYTWADASWVHLDIKFRDELPERLVLDADVVPGARRADYRVSVDRVAGSARLEVRRELDPIRLDTPMRPYVEDMDAPWHLYRLITNQSYEKPAPHPAEYQDVGELVEGIWDPKSPDYVSTSTWQVNQEHRTISLRIPWSMLGFADPSSRIALGEGEPAELVEVDGITFRFDADGARHEQVFTWPSWNRADYTERPKQGIEVLEQAFRELAP
ncbi:hypothetical protein [Nocardioides houyundeii]|uniref:hypothetical protein n=1 Tax=Nocardioides houyundeii TaxID=2045452 RepID=UPI000DF23FEC|nr:hypothetical protein [Nocardioides houyundeii]